MKVTLIGAGPGDPGLITMKGINALQKADVVVYDALAAPQLLAHARPEAELIYVGKIAGNHALPQNEINALLAEKALQGKNVARLKGGDPYIFGRGGEEGEYLLERGIDYEEIPGISSAIAAPAYAGIPVTHRSCTSAVSIITGHEADGKKKSALNWQAFAKSGATLVFLMGMKNIATIAENLISAGMDGATPSSVVYRGTTPFQRVIVAPLAQIAQKARDCDLGNPAVIVVGKVVGFHEKLGLLQNKPLSGKTIVVTRAREQASGMAATLAELGANVIQFPTIKIIPLEDYTILNKAIEHLPEYSWLVFTSVNGVKYFRARLDACGKDSRALAGAKIAAIGPATRDALKNYGITPDLVPPTYVAESVASQIIAQEPLAGKSVLLPRALEAREALPEILASAGARVDVAPAYRTVPEEANTEEILRLLKQKRLDCVSFGSSSTVRNFSRLISPELLLKHPETALAAIGPVTAKTMDELGLKVSIMPQTHTIPGLVAAIAEYFATPQNSEGK